MSVKRLVMIMGVQRSGTTALYSALAAATGVTGRNEHPDDQIYENYYLRPEPEVRATLAALPGTVILKPVRESMRRSPQEVAEEYADYDLTIVWSYRDPVNVYHSWVVKGWVQNYPGFTSVWLRRNRSCLEAREALGDRLVVVRYEDLVSHPSCCDALAATLGLAIRPEFRADSNLGRVSLPAEVQSTIDGQTRATLARLDAARTIRPAP